MPALLALATVKALVQVSYLRPFVLQFPLEVGFALQCSLEKRFVRMALGFQLDVVELAKDNRFVGEGAIIALIGQGWRFREGGGVFHDDRYSEIRSVCPVISSGWPKKTYGEAEYLPPDEAQLGTMASCLPPHSPLRNPSIRMR